MRALETVASGTRSEISDEVRFYRLLIDNDQGDISVYREVSDVNPARLAPLVNAHQSQFEGWLFDEVGFAPVDDWLLLSPSTEIEMLASVLDGRYAAVTLPVEKVNNRALSDNPVDELTDVLLTQGSVIPSWLFSQYLDELR
ncbi:hypothetical protein, partial [Haloferax profundi]|uniref:hypothetical protein n=1 Tax=Haloferax profundi TaxID=1544718 RepID=UPI0012F9734D